MKLLLPIVAIAVSLANAAFCEEYTNRSYGISVRPQGGWKLEQAAKLEVNLHELSAEQLTELFRTYAGFGVVRLAKGVGNERAQISIDFATPRGELESALEKAKGYEKGAKSRKEAILVSATERDLAGIPAAYLATKLVGRNLIRHQFFVRRARSFVIISCSLPDGHSEAHFDELMEMLSNVKIEVDADSRNAK